MSRLVLFKASVKRDLIETWRYGFELASGILALFVLFLLVFYGARALIGSGPGQGDTLSAIVVGYLVWMLAILAYSQTMDALVQEATAGTLEQLAMSPFGLVWAVVMRFLGSLLTQLALILVVLVLMMASTGRWLNLDLVSIVPLLLLTLGGVYGLGLMFGGMALVFKRMQSFLQIFQFLFVALVAVPPERVPVFKYLPLAWGNRLIGRVMIDDDSLFAMPATDVAFLVVHAAAWIALGTLAFRAFEKVARDRALLGHY